MSTIISVLKTKLGEYMLSLPDGAVEYEDYEAWGQGFTKRVVSQSSLSLLTANTFAGCFRSFGAWARCARTHCLDR